MRSLQVKHGWANPYRLIGYIGILNHLGVSHSYHIPITSLVTFVSILFDKIWCWILRVALIAPRSLCPGSHFPKPSQRGLSFTSDNAPSNWWPYTEYGAFFRYFWINYFHEVKILLRQLYDESILVFKCLDLSTPSTYLTFIVDTLVQSSVGTKSRLLVLFGYDQQPWMQMQRSSFTHTRAMRIYCQLYYCGPKHR